MAPPAGVEPTTYRLGGGFSYHAEIVDLPYYPTLARPISLAMRTAFKSLIWQDDLSDFGRSNHLNSYQREGARFDLHECPAPQENKPGGSYER